MSTIPPPPREACYHDWQPTAPRGKYDTQILYYCTKCLDHRWVNVPSHLGQPRMT